MILFWLTVLYSGWLAKSSLSTRTFNTMSFKNEIEVEADTRFQAQWFPQYISHFPGPNYLKTFQQLYFANYDYYKPGGPAFLYISGEGPLSSSWVEKTLLVEAAKQHNGVVFALEHRYYGQSLPFPDHKIENLKYLNVQEALADIANFVKSIKMTPNDNIKSSTGKSRPSWIISGCSYAGNLAAWSRLVYPDLIRGAVAGSAPVQVKTDFFEYDLQIQKSLLALGGPLCLDYFVSVISNIDAILMSNNKSDIDSLKSKFGCQTVASDQFADALNYFHFKIRAHEPNGPGDIVKYCRSLKLNGTKEERIEDFSRDFKLALDGASCEQFVDISALKDVQPGKYSHQRLWRYQTCTELGYYQSAPPNDFSSTRSRLVNLNFLLKEYCYSIFDSLNHTLPKVEVINSRYKGKKINDPNILFTSGDMDPWSSLTVTEPGTFPARVLSIKGAPHCSDSKIPNPNDTINVDKAKKFTLNFISCLL